MPRRGMSVHRPDPAAASCAGKVVGREDRTRGLFPAKVREAKIDAAVALVVAVGRMQADAASPEGRV